MKIREYRLPYLRLITICLLFAWILFFKDIHAHVNSISYSFITINNQNVVYKLMVYISDLWQFVLIDEDENGRITIDELHRRKSAIFDYVNSKIMIRNNGDDIRATPSDFQIVKDKQDTTLLIGVEMDLFYGSPVPWEKVSITCRIFEETDYLHQSTGIIKIGNLTEEFYFFRDNSYSVNLVELSTGRKIKANIIYAFYSWKTTLLRLLFLIILLLPVGCNSIKTITSFSLWVIIAAAMAASGMVELSKDFAVLTLFLSFIYVAGENLFFKNPGDRWVLAGFLGIVYGFHDAHNYLEQSTLKSTFTSLSAYEAGLAINLLIIGWCSFSIIKVIQRSTQFKTILSKIISCIALLTGVAGCIIIIWETYV